MKYLIAGLGNIGSEYVGTRHNIGFDVVEHMAQEKEVAFESERYGDMAKIKHKGRTLILLKPSTYMNLSGKAVDYWMKKEKITHENILVITDDLALPFGKLRMRTKGSDGGHNGLKNINEILGHSTYPRVRFGISGDFPQGHQVDYVLSKWDATEKASIIERIKLAGEMTMAFVTMGPARAMSQFNNK